jgi:SAM-dependent methyltransferase
MNRGYPEKLQHDTHKRNVAEFFSRSTQYWAEAYAAADHEAETFDAFAKGRRKQLVLEMLDRCAAGRQLAVLDIGCGPGLFLEEAVRRGHTVYGIDLSEQMVSAANARLGNSISYRTPCRQGDAENLPFASGSMDLILCLGVLPYLRSDSTAVAEMVRVLKDGGCCIVVLPNLVKLGNLFDPYYYLIRGWQYLWYRLFRSDAAPAEKPLNPARFGSNSRFGIKRYTAARIRRIFPQSLFRVVESRGIDYGPFTFWKKRFLPDRVTIALSKLLAITGQKTSRPWVTGLANECVLRVTIDKNSQGQEQR